MARGERKNVDYFPHYISHGSKMNYLRSKYGNDGYATWFMILEKIGRSDNHYIDLSEDLMQMFLADECMIDEQKLVEIIEILVKFNEFDKQLWDEFRVIYCEKFVESIADAWKNRKTNLPTKQSILTYFLQKHGKIEPEKPVKDEKDGNQSLNKTKRNKTKVNDIKVYANNCQNEVDELLRDELLLEPIAMKRRSDLKEIKIQLDNFISENRILEKKWDNRQEFRRHFLNWINKQPKTQQEQPKGKSIKML